MEYLALRKEIITMCQTFNSTGLSVGTSGNLSARIEAGCLITPTGVPYGSIEPRHIVQLNTKGSVISGDNKPSSEWHFHHAIYNSRPDVNAIVHVHSPYATAIACTRQGIPAFHYMVAKAGGDSIRCARYATFGTMELSENALLALKDRMACLLANHGVIALGLDLQSAFEIAELIEELAKQYIMSNQSGEPVLLSGKEMRINLEKFETYGKQDSG